jgi:hypothetical protein
VHVIKLADRVIQLLRYVAIVGNGVYILWIVWNGINEGFKSTPVQVVSYLGIITLLALNGVLLYRQTKV